MIQLIDYSIKAVAVIGDTKPIKDQLKSIGGRFNARLKVGGQTVSGWIFSKAKSLERLNRELKFSTVEDDKEGKSTADYIQAQEEASTLRSYEIEI